MAGVRLTDGELQALLCTQPSMKLIHLDVEREGEDLQYCSFFSKPAVLDLSTDLQIRINECLGHCHGWNSEDRWDAAPSHRARLFSRPRLALEFGKLLLAPEVGRQSMAGPLDLIGHIDPYIHYIHYAHDIHFISCSSDQLLVLQFELNGMADLQAKWWPLQSLPLFNLGWNVVKHFRDFLREEIRVSERHVQARYRPQSKEQHDIHHSRR